MVAKSSPAFISISGVAGSGKSTVSEYLKQKFSVRYSINDFSFAGPLKDALVLWFGWDRQRLDTDFAYKEGSTLDDGTPDPFCERLGMSRRTIMQRMGTECMRQGMHQNFWIIMADLGVKLGRIDPSDIFIISDARFQNELDWVESINAYRILMLGNTLTTHTTHASETEFLGWNGYDEQIRNSVDPALSREENMYLLTRYLDEITIPRIQKRFEL